MKHRLFALAALGTLAFAQQVCAQDQTQPDRSVLPVALPLAGAVIHERAEDSTPAALMRLRAPQGAPNIFLFMADDVGFAMSSAFGGPVPTPNMERLAAMGQRYNRFHTTGICSPSRAALLTGRNHHNVGMGYLADFPMGYPGYTGQIPPEAATIAQTLRLNGYNTGMWGKHHNVPPGETSAAGPFDHWPTGLGFEYFFGFIGGSANQWRPDLVRDTVRIADRAGPAELLDKRLADDAINWMHNQKAAAPDKPFFMYWAPGSTHAPHAARPEDIARFKGRFDQGWDKVREETFQRQLAAGVIPRGTKLTPRPDKIPAWDSLTPEQKRYAARSMEVAAAMLAYQDAQLGRVVDEMQRTGVFDKTLFIVVQGDNGASAEAGPRGLANERSEINGAEETDAWRDTIVDELGSERLNTNYPVGWAWAMNTPLRWTKQFASMLGGVRNGMIISWKGHIARPGTICSEFGHLVDIAPTILEAAGLPIPKSVLGVAQKPMDGESLLPSLAACQPDHPRTQYFEMNGKLGFYHNGWFASLDDGRAPWEPIAPDGTEPRWTLFNLDEDFSQSTDVSSRFPQKMNEMVAMWKADATRNGVFPLYGRSPVSRGVASPKTGERLEFWSSDTSILASRLLGYVGRPYVLNAELDVSQPTTSGVIVALGSRQAGWTLFLDQGKPTFVYARSTMPGDTTKLVAERALPAGRDTLRLTFTPMGKQAEVIISDASGELVRGTIPNTFRASAQSNETIDIGRDTGLPVIDYPFDPAALAGAIRHVAIDIAAQSGGRQQ